jgi:hypothetical protein
MHYIHEDSEWYKVNSAIKTVKVLCSFCLILNTFYKNWCHKEEKNFNLSIFNILNDLTIEFKKININLKGINERN